MASGRFSVIQAAAPRCSNRMVAGGAILFCLLKVVVRPAPGKGRALLLVQKAD